MHFDFLVAAYDLFQWVLQPAVSDGEQFIWHKTILKARLLLPCQLNWGLKF